MNAVQDHAPATAHAPLVARTGATLEWVGVAMIAVYLAMFVVRNAPFQGDFRTYQTAARAAVAGLDPYQPETLQQLSAQELMPFVYPPITLPPFVVLQSLPFRVAAALWIGFKVALLLGLVFAWRRWFVPGAGLLPLVLVTVFGWNQSALWDLRVGNVALVECALLWAAFACFVADRRTLFAAFVVAAACFKIMPAAFLLLLLVPAEASAPSLRRFAVAIASVALLVAGPLAIGPASRWEWFFAHVPAANTLGEANPSALGFLIVLAHHVGLASADATRIGTAAWVAYALGLFALSVPFLRRAWQARDARRWVMAAVFLYVLLAPRPMAYGFTLLAPAPLFFLPAPFDRPAGRWLLALTFAAQGLTRAARHDSSAIAFVYAPFLLTACVWLLVLFTDAGAARRAHAPHAAGAAG